MEATLVAHTQLENFGERILEDMTIQEEPTDAETLIEYAGRGCYLSYDRPNTQTRNNEDYLRRTVFEQQHGSIIEHATATLRLTGVSRAFLAEITRHRHLSFSVESQRFVNTANNQPVIPPAIQGNEQAEQKLRDHYNQAVELYETLTAELQDQGYGRKQAREAARAVLPNMTSTSMVVSGNLRAWLHFCERRTAPDADAEMQLVATHILYELEKVSPTLFGPLLDELEGI